MSARLALAPVALTLISRLVSVAGAGELRVAGPVGDHMVVQRGVSVPVRGWARPGSPVVVRLDGVAHPTTAGADGAWRVTLPPMQPGQPRDLTVESGGEGVRITDVVAGDVWVCSGQSNMEWKVADARDGAMEVAAANDPMIRHFQVSRGWAAVPGDVLEGGSWEPAAPEGVGAFTAVGYFFARELRRHVSVPIGLINSTWGGSRIETWMSAPALGLDAAGAARVLDEEKVYAERVLAKLRARIGSIPDRDEGLVGGRPVWADPTLDDSGWDRIRVPGQWETQGFDGMDGVAWYRTSFDLGADDPRDGVRVGLGAIDESDTTWVNGKEVGATTNAWNKARVYDVPAGVLRAGRNVIAVRVEDTGGGGGIWGEPGLVYIEVGGKRRPLAGEWRFRPAVVKVDLEFHKNQVPTVVFNRMIHPLLAFPIKGVLWYQGESNATPEDAFAYRTLFAAMIRSWRAAWGVGDFPFLWVQLANFRSAPAEPAESSWAMLRESQSDALALPRTAQAVAIDIGDPDDIHPRNKQEVGRRLALAARSVAYGERLEFSGPVYRRHSVKGDTIEVEFTHAGGRLVAKGASDGRVGSFAICGGDRRFVPADAVIRGDRVIVRSAAVARPVAVRYAWADAPEGANLANAEGLPASPFRTDRW